MNQIKVVAFDFDDTLYSGMDWSVWMDFAHKGVKHILLQHGLPISLANKLSTFTDVGIVKFLLQLGIASEVWLNYKKQNIRGLHSSYNYSNVVVVNNDVLKNFSEKRVLYIVSNSSKQEIEAAASILGINLTYFKAILTNPYQGQDLSKKSMLNTILQAEQIEKHELLMVGDSLESDIKPAKQLGIAWCLVYEATFNYDWVKTNFKFG